MGRKRKFDGWSEETTVHVHVMLDNFILAAEKGVEAGRDMYHLQRLDWIKGNIRYWENVVSGLTWVKSLIPQLKESENGVEQSSENPGRREDTSGDSEAGGRVNDDERSSNRPGPVTRDDPNGLAGDEPNDKDPQGEQGVGSQVT